MKPRVHHFDKQTEDVMILEHVSFSGVDIGLSAGLSKVIRDFIAGAKNNKPPKPRYHLHEEYPNILRGEPSNFQSDEREFGVIRMLQVAQDEEEQFYLRFETKNGFYYILIP